jgi:hypothetical protein
MLLFFLISLIPSLVYGRGWSRDDACPSEIKANIPNGDYCDRPDGHRVPCDRTQEPYFGTMVSVHDALSHCPNISSLNLRVTPLGCSNWPDRWNLPLSYNGGETYPALKRLRLEGYDFSSVEDVRPPWQPHTVGEGDSGGWTFGLAAWIKKGYWKPWLWEQLYGYPPSRPAKSNLDLWLNTMDWSRIEELAINNCRNSEKIAENLPAHLRSLAKLESTDISFIEALPTNTLMDLTWVGRHKVGDLESILERHGTSLQRLEFRCNELSCPSMRNKFNISSLPKLAQNITHISINIPRNGTWPLRDLKTLAALPQLRSLKIYSQLQSECQRQKPEGYSRAMWDYMKENGEEHCTGPERLHQPILDEATAEELWLHIKQGKTGGHLQNLTIRVGDWSPSWGGPIYTPPWMESRQAEIVCTSSATSGIDKTCKMEVSRGYWPPQTKNWESDDWMFDDIEFDPADYIEEHL